MEQQLDASLMNEVERIAGEYPNALVALLDQTGNIHFMSHSSQALLGYRPEELIGQNLNSFIHPHDLERVSLAIQDAMLNEQSVEITVSVHAKTGEYMPVRGFAYQLIDPETDEVFLLARSERIKPQS